MNALTKHRPGSSLIEMLVVMAVMVTVMTLLAMVADGLLKVERKGREHQARTVALFILARDFKADVRSCEHAELPDADPAKTALLLTRSDGTRITYERTRGQLVRVERVGDTVRRQEVLLVARDRDPRFEIESAGKGEGRVVVMKLRERAKDERENARELFMEGVLGAGLRFMRGGRSQ
jgi:hypothetical protein